MSFNQPFSDTTTTATTTDAWKPILGGTFTAMGLMTIGIYLWLSQTGYSENSSGQQTTAGKFSSEIMKENMKFEYDLRH